jgi:hypothetical protein
MVLLLLKPGLDLAPGKPPLAADFESTQAAVIQHAVDRDPIDLE